MARQHTMTPKRRAALKKAQMASARKRRGKGKGKLAAANRRADKNRISTRRKIIGGAMMAVGYGMMGYAYGKQLKANRQTDYAHQYRQAGMRFADQFRMR